MAAAPYLGRMAEEDKQRSDRARVQGVGLQFAVRRGLPTTLRTTSPRRDCKGTHRGDSYRPLAHNHEQGVGEEGQGQRSANLVRDRAEPGGGCGEATGTRSGREHQGQGAARRRRGRFAGGRAAGGRGSTSRSSSGRRASTAMARTMSGPQADARGPGHPELERLRSSATASARKACKPATPFSCACRSAARR